MHRGTIVGTVSAAILAVVPAPAAAQTPKLPTGKAGDVVIKRSGRTVVVSFHRGAARAFRVIAGRSVDVECVALGTTRRTGLTVQEGSTEQTRAPKRRRAFRVGIDGRSDYCVVSRSRYSRRKGNTITTFPSRRVAAVPLTQRGAVYLDERRKGADLLRVAGTADVLADERRDDTYPPAAEIVRRVRGTVVLANPEATPPPGRVGVFTSGADITVATLTAVGRRIFFQVQGDRFSTNVAEQLFTGE